MMLCQQQNIRRFFWDAFRRPFAIFRGPIRITPYFHKFMAICIDTLESYAFDKKRKDISLFKQA